MKTKRWIAILIVGILASNCVSCSQLQKNERKASTKKNNELVKVGVYDMYDLETYMTNMGRTCRSL